jgi:GGDEF domain-containing protein
LNDELTGLLNRRGFMQTATRLLDVALRDCQAAHLVYFRLDVGLAESAKAASGESCARNVLLRRMGNFLRDLFPSYGVYEAIGRLGATEFAALTPLTEHASRAAIMLRARSPESGREAPALPVRVGIARFHSAIPAAIDELLQTAERAVEEVREPVTPIAPIASAGSAPRSDLTLA